MTRLQLALVSATLCAIAITAKADLRDQLNVQTGKAELVVTGMDPNEVASKMKEAISQFAIPSNLNFRSLPDEIPERPDRPEIKQVYIQGSPVVEYQCPTAYAEITKSPPPVSNAFAFIVERLQICLYSFQKGTKAYLIFTRGKKTESLTAGLFNGITKAIQGTDGERIAKQLQENIADIRKTMPTLLVARLEVPGMPLQEPDKAAVAALIPAKPLAPPQQAQVPVFSAISPPLVTAVTSAQQTKIEARKSLTAMGMTYHSQEQFFGAIRRKDDVAVQQFLEADGIDLVSKDAKGKTALETANEVGAVDVAALINAMLEKKAAPIAQVTQPVKAVAALSASATSSTFKPAGLTGAQLPPEILKQLNEKIEAMDLPAEQKEIMRGNLILQMQSVMEFSKQFGPNTGAPR